jgi:hypothetical protein
LKPVRERSAADFRQIVPVVRNTFGADPKAVMRAAAQMIQPRSRVTASAVAAAAGSRAVPAATGSAQQQQRRRPPSGAA